MLTQSQFLTLKPFLPAKRRPPKYDAYRVLNGILFVLSSGCSWRQLPAEYGSWHTVYTRFKRWAEAGIFGRILHQLHKEKILDLRVIFLDSTTVRAHHSSSGALKKRGLNPLGDHGED